jgi:hypothetical protein
VRRKGNREGRYDACAARYFAACQAQKVQQPPALLPLMQAVLHQPAHTVKEASCTTTSMAVCQMRIIPPKPPIAHVCCCRAGHLCRYTAAAARSLVLKQCLQLPKPLWREVMELMGGEYADTSRREARLLGDE